MLRHGFEEMITIVGGPGPVAQPLIMTIHHFTVVCLVTWPLNGSEARGDLVLIQTSAFVM